MIIFELLDRGLFQKDVAMPVGVRTDTVTNCEKNRSNPALRAIPRVLEFMGYDPRITPKSLAAQRTNLRRKRGLTHKELAKTIRVDPSMLSRWEQGERTPHGPCLERVELVSESV